jgi:hypothetical protein
VRLDVDLLHAVAGALDMEMGEYFVSRIPGHEPTTQELVSYLLEVKYREANDLGALMIARATEIAQVTSTEDLDARKGEVARILNGWLDGFVIATRYAAQTAKPKPEMRTV